MVEDWVENLGDKIIQKKLNFYSLKNCWVEVGTK